MWNFTLKTASRCDLKKAWAGIGQVASHTTRRSTRRWLPECGIWPRILANGKMRRWMKPSGICWISTKRLIENEDLDSQKGNKIDSAQTWRDREHFTIACDDSHDSGRLFVWRCLWAARFSPVGTAIIARILLCPSENSSGPYAPARQVPNLVSWSPARATTASWRMLWTWTACSLWNMADSRVRIVQNR